MGVFHINTGQGIKKVATAAQMLSCEAKGTSVLFLTPHDDDTHLPAGMLVAKLVEEGFDVHIGITTDGGMGYCSMEEKETIVDIRAKETVDSFVILGLPADNVHYLGFPDGSLFNYIGRRAAVSGDAERAGHTGLENHFTGIIRDVKPKFIFTPSGSDLHPDHQAVYKELLISIFHASGDIWPELGAPVALPEVYEFPIYVKMAHDPEIMFEGDAEIMQKKLDSIACFKSQKQISQLIENVKSSGPYEFFRNLQFDIYKAEDYRKLFS